MTIGNYVNFVSTTLVKYQALTTKDADSLYFIEDAKKIYKGIIDITEAIRVVDSFDDTPGDDIVEGKLYLNATTFECRIKNGTSWVVANPGYISTGDQFIDANSSKIATVGATKAYITQAIADITGGTAFVKGITYDSTNGKLSIDKGEEVATEVQLTGVAHAPTYDATNLKLTIPVVGGEDVVVNIPKDKFVTAGAYNPETGNIELTIENQEEKVLIPATAFVNIYTGIASDNITVTVNSETNEIKATAIIDPIAGNALVSSEKGLKVDLTNVNNSIATKANKLTSTASTHILVGSSDGDIADSGVIVNTTGELGSSTTEVPVASLVAAAISTAVSAAQGTLESAIDSLTSTVNSNTASISELQTAIATKIESMGAGNADEVVLSTTDGGIVRSGKKIGGESLSITPDANTLATEKAVHDAISWKTLD